MQVFTKSSGCSSSEQVDDRDQRDAELEGLSSLDYHKRLTHFARGSTRHCVDGSITVVDFRPLYAITIHNLQRRLAERIQSLLHDDLDNEHLEAISKLLKEYSKSSFRVVIDLNVRRRPLTRICSQRPARL